MRKALVGAAITVLSLCASPATAQSTAAVEIHDAVLDEDGSTRLTVSVTGDAVADTVLAAEAFTVLEDGTRVGQVEVEPVLTSEQVPVSVVLVMDVSGSTQGEPIEAAKASATGFAQRLLEQGASVGVVAFGQTAQVRVPLTSDTGRVVGALSQLEAGGETALHDGIVLAADQFDEVPGIRRLIVFSDGGDTVSESTSEQAVVAASDADAPITVVALQTPEFDPESVSGLARGSGGRTVAVDQAAGLAQAFDDVAREIASNYVVTYESTITEPVELPIVVRVEADGAVGEGSIVALNGRKQLAVAPPELPAAPLAAPLVEVLSDDVGLLVGLGATGAATALLLLVLLWKPGNERVTRTLNQSLRVYGRGREGLGPETRELPTARITERAVEFVGRLPKPSGFEESLQQRLERAAWPIRANEFLVMSLGAALLGALTGFALSDGWPLAVIGFAVGGAVPELVLRQRIANRRKRFLDQLPGTLQLLAGSLQAGYGLLQAIDTVIQELEPPTSEEFARVLTETRLGMPLDEALETMADRIDSEDFRWVVLAITIQRQVGGNLAELLSTVADTMRARAQVRRHVRVLSAEGRISAWVVGAMPFVVAGFLTILNPGYLSELFQRTVGQVMLLFGGILMVVGMAWIRKIVKIEY